MIIHLVAWSFRDDVPANERVTIDAGLARGRDIAQARTFAISENGSPVRADGLTHAYLATFADRDALASYQRDERHAPVGRRLADASAQLMVLERMIGIVPHLTREQQERMAQWQAAMAASASNKGH